MESKIWEISIIELKNNKKRYKVTRKISELSITETKFFEKKEEATKQFEEWL